jgi:sugar phosphate isomerase/epimerase
MIHFKQARRGESQLTVCDGDIDWQHQLECLQAAKFDGPALFELPPHEQIWDHLRQSREYLADLGPN